MGLLLGIILMVVGIIFISIPESVAEFLAIFTGAVIIIFGLFRIITVVQGWELTVNRALLLLFGIILSAIGFFMLFNPDAALTIIGAVIGIFAIILALDRFITANRLKGQINTLPTIISGLIHLIFGLGMIYSAVFVFSVIIILTGVYLLITGIMIALSASLFHDI